MALRIIKSDAGETVERSGEPIFEGGQVWARPLTGDGGSRDLSVALVQFGGGARAGWHRHSNDQVLYVVAGIGKVGDREGEHIVSAGDAVIVPANAEHWHGAHDTGSPMSHLAITPAGTETTVLDG